MPDITWFQPAPSFLTSKVQTPLKPRGVDISPTTARLTRVVCSERPAGTRDGVAESSVVNSEIESQRDAQTGIPLPEPPSGARPVQRSRSRTCVKHRAAANLWASKFGICRSMRTEATAVRPERARTMTPQYFAVPCILPHEYDDVNR